MLLRRCCCCFVFQSNRNPNTQRTLPQFAFESHEDCSALIGLIHTPLVLPETASNPGVTRSACKRCGMEPERRARNSAQRHIRSVTDWLAAVRLIVLLLQPSPRPNRQTFSAEPSLCCRTKEILLRALTPILASTWTTTVSVEGNSQPTDRPDCSAHAAAQIESNPTDGDLTRIEALQAGKRKRESYHSIMVLFFLRCGNLPSFQTGRQYIKQGGNLPPQTTTATATTTMKRT